MEKGIRVNAVAPGPIYSPLIPATFDEEKVEHQGDETPMGRRGQPAELAPSYVFLATHADSSILLVKSFMSMVAILSHLNKINSATWS